MARKLPYLLLLIAVYFFGSIGELTAQMNDIDGNSYPTVVIGNQEWMAKNLRSSRLNNGMAIPLETNNTAWVAAAQPVSCWYANDSVQHDIDFGRLYNGITVLNPDVCPTGWSIPTVRDWDEMVDFLGGPTVAGGKLKQVGFEYWDEPNAGATNSSGFTALPSGYRSQTDGSFNYKGQRAGWFVLAPNNSLAFRWVSWSIANAGTGPISPQAGLAIRCMRPAPSTSSLDKSETEKIQFYPNPARDQLQIRLPDYMAEKPVELQLYDLMGRLVLKTILTALITPINLSEIPTGAYVLLCKNRGEILLQQKVLVTP